MTRSPGCWLLLALLAFGVAGRAAAEEAVVPPADTDLPVAAPAEAPPAVVPAPLYTGPDAQTLLLDVALDYRVVYTRLRAEITRLGVTYGLDLVDDGSAAGDDAHDGVYTNRVRGAYARYVTVRLYATDSDGAEALLYAGVVTTPDRDQNTVAWRVSDFGGHVRTERVAMAWPGGPDALVDGAPVLVAFAWGGLVILFVGVLVRRADHTA